MDQFQHSGIKDITTVKENFFGDLLSKEKAMWRVPKKSKVIELLQGMCGASMEVLNRQYKTYFDLSDKEIDGLHQDTGN